MHASPDHETPWDEVASSPSEPSPSEPSPSEPSPIERIPYTTCPLCDGREMRELIRVDCTGHDLYKPGLPKIQIWVTCDACGHVFTDGYFSDEALALVFTGAHAAQTPGFQVETWRIYCANLVEQVEQARDGRQGRWLDVGFGAGSLIWTAAEFGWDALGLDLRTANVEAMRSEGFEVYAEDFLDFDPGDPLDVISFADVLEHIPFPKPVLQKALTVLKPDGLLMLSMPNKDAYPWTVLNRMDANPYWVEIEHFHNFGRARLYALLEECGFKPVRYFRSERYRVCMQVFAEPANT